ncbi:MAG: Mu-like prophage major head subunit gpT family protein [Sphingomonas sp.]|jgi:phage major head subunit gpT-like protein
MMTNSSGSEEVYAWLGQLPSIREWVGDRIAHNLELHGFSIVNKKFESTLAVPRTSIEDDKIGALSPLFEDLGRRAAEFPDELFAQLVQEGFSANCYDGQFFFDTDHPVKNAVGEGVSSVSNFQGGSGPAWYCLRGAIFFDTDHPVKNAVGEGASIVFNFQGGSGPAWHLLDLSRAVCLFIYQERLPFDLQRRDRHRTWPRRRLGPDRGDRGWNASYSAFSPLKRRSAKY